MSWLSLWTHRLHCQPLSAPPRPAPPEDNGEWRLWKDPQMMDILRMQMW